MTVDIRTGDFRDLAREPDADAGAVALEPPTIVTIPPGAWCASSSEGGGDGRADRLTLIRSKNTAFHSLYEGVLHCERRRHSAGLVPSTWLERLAELEAQYRAAVGMLAVPTCILER